MNPDMINVLIYVSAFQLLIGEQQTFVWNEDVIDWDWMMDNSESSLRNYVLAENVELRVVVKQVWFCLSSHKWS